MKYRVWKPTLLIIDIEAASREDAIETVGWMDPITSETPDGRKGQLIAWTGCPPRMPKAVLLTEGVCLCPPTGRRQ